MAPAKTLFVTFLCLIFGAGSSSAQPTSPWVHKTDSDVVFVFVHGVLSDSEQGWRHNDGSYWPDILKADERLRNPNIYLGGYPTSIDDPRFGIDEAAKHLYGRLNGVGPGKEISVLSKSEIIFIAHSTGGLVVRQMLVNQPKGFENKKIGLFLLASPSRGSEWADRVKILTKSLSHRMLSELERNSDFVVNLDKKFSELLARNRTWMIAGMDVFESRFIVPGYIWNSTVVVDPDSSRYYFGEPRLVPRSDHFSISKPTLASGDKEAYSHEYLVEFYAQRFEPEILSLLRCRNGTVRAENPGRFAKEILHQLPVRAIEPVITRVQFEPKTSPVTPKLDEVCYMSRQQELKVKMQFQAYGEVTCEAGGLKARGEKRYSTIKYMAPPESQIVGPINTQPISINRGQIEDVRPITSKGVTIGVEATISCQSPSIPFGPRAWSHVALAGQLERIPSESELSQARELCTK